MAADNYENGNTDELRVWGNDTRSNHVVPKNLIMLQLGEKNLFTFFCA